MNYAVWFHKGYACGYLNKLWITFRENGISVENMRSTIWKILQIFHSLLVLNLISEMGEFKGK